MQFHYQGCSIGLNILINNKTGDLMNKINVGLAIIISFVLSGCVRNGEISNNYSFTKETSPKGLVALSMYCNAAPGIGTLKVQLLKEFIADHGPSTITSLGKTFLSGLTLGAYNDDSTFPSPSFTCDDPSTLEENSSRKLILMRLNPGEYVITSWNINQYQKIIYPLRNFSYRFSVNENQVSYIGMWNINYGYNDSYIMKVSFGNALEDIKQFSKEYPNIPQSTYHLVVPYSINENGGKKVSDS